MLSKKSAGKHSKKMLCLHTISDVIMPNFLRVFKPLYNSKTNTSLSHKYKPTLQIY